MALYQQYALALTQKYEPNMAQALIEGITGVKSRQPGATKLKTGADRENGHMRKARERAQSAAQPD